MTTYEVLVSFENYRVGQLVFRVNEPGDLTWRGLERSGYVKQLPSSPEAEAVMEQIEVKPKRRKTKEADSGEDSAEPGERSPGSPE